MATRRRQSPEVLWSFLPRPRPYGGVGIFGRTTVKVEPQGPRGGTASWRLPISLCNRVRANCSLFWRPADAKFAEQRLAPSAKVAGAAGPQAPLVRFLLQLVFGRVRGLGRLWLRTLGASTSTRQEAPEEAHDCGCDESDDQAVGQARSHCRSRRDGNGNDCGLDQRPDHRTHRSRNRGLPRGLPDGSTSRPQESEATSVRAPEPSRRPAVEESERVGPEAQPLRLPSPMGPSAVRRISHPRVSRKENNSLERDYIGKWAIAKTRSLPLAPGA